MEKKERFEVVYLFVKSFDYHKKVVGDQFNYEPQPKKIYRAVKDNKGDTWRIPLEGIKIPGLQGIVFEKLIDENPSWSCEIVEVNYENLRDIKVPTDEVEKVMDWESDQQINIDFLKETLEMGEGPVKMNEEKSVENPIVIESDNKEETLNIFNQLLHDYVEVYNARDGVGSVMADVMEYLKTTYKDKYTDPNSPLDTKRFLYHETHGKSVNMFCASKYMQRYMTEGFDKSGNPIDLMKAIHYILFELSRLQLTNYVRGEEERLIEGNRGDEKTNLEPKSGGKGVAKGTGRKRGRPRKNS